MEAGLQGSNVYCGLVSLKLRLCRAERWFCELHFSTLHGSISQQWYHILQARRYRLGRVSMSLERI